jgi:very-short-patch-repair endonuclease
MTRAEQLLWRYLKAHHLDGLGFRRQVPMGAYIVDFVCHAARLVVELDGGTHDFAARQAYDLRRDAWLATRGYFVLRVLNEDVMSNLEGTLEFIGMTARQRLGTPLPIPPPQAGEGGAYGAGVAQRRPGNRRAKK